MSQYKDIGLYRTSEGVLIPQYTFYDVDYSSIESISRGFSMFPPHGYPERIYVDNCWFVWSDNPGAYIEVELYDKAVSYWVYRFHQANQSYAWVRPVEPLSEEPSPPKIEKIYRCLVEPEVRDLLMEQILEKSSSGHPESVYKQWGIVALAAYYQQLAYGKINEVYNLII